MGNIRAIDRKPFLQINHTGAFQRLKTSFQNFPLIMLFHKNLIYLSKIRTIPV